MSNGFRQGECPYCGADLAYVKGANNHEFFGSDGLLFNAECPSCGKISQELYTIEFVGFADETGKQL